MFSRGSYLILDSVIPPTVDEDVLVKESLIRLEKLSACVVVRNIRSIHPLSNIPTLLHKIMWEAYLRDEYYAHTVRLENHYRNTDNNYNYPSPGLDELPELLYHWPHEEFSLKELMPKLPAKLYLHNQIYPLGRTKALKDYDYYYENMIYLDSFYVNVVEIIVNMFKRNNNQKYLEYTHTCNIRKINLSGFNVFDWHRFKGDFVHMQNPFLKEHAGKIELVVDMDIGEDIADVLDLQNIQFENDLHGLKPLGPNSYNSSNTVSLKFGHVSLCTPFSHEVDAWERPIFEDGTWVRPPIECFGTLFDMLLQKGPTSIELDGDAVLQFISTHDENLLNILGLSLSSQYEEGFSSLNFLQHFRNLIDLDLSTTNLHGRLNGLNHMQTGLVFLSLPYCDLENDDLEELIGSCHQSTLKELNLSSNYFRDGTNLTELCKKFTNIIKLGLNSCNLNSWQYNHIQLLLDTFRNMPNIIILDLIGNHFSNDTIRLVIKSLSTSPSLKYLKLSNPRSNDDIALSDEINTSTIRNRSQRLYVEFFES